MSDYADLYCEAYRHWRTAMRMDEIAEEYYKGAPEHTALTNAAHESWCRFIAYPRTIQDAIYDIRFDRAPVEAGTVINAMGYKQQRMNSRNGHRDFHFRGGALHCQYTAYLRRRARHRLNTTVRDFVRDLLPWEGWR